MLHQPLKAFYNYHLHLILLQKMFPIFNH
jgi:hypothetical protein